MPLQNFIIFKPSLFLYKTTSIDYINPNNLFYDNMAHLEVSLELLTKDLTPLIMTKIYELFDASFNPQSLHTLKHKSPLLALKLILFFWFYHKICKYHGYKCDTCYGPLKCPIPILYIL